MQVFEVVANNLLDFVLFSDSVKAVSRGKFIVVNVHVGKTKHQINNLIMPVKSYKNSKFCTREEIIRIKVEIRKLRLKKYKNQ